MFTYVLVWVYMSPVIWVLGSVRAEAHAEWSCFLKLTQNLFEHMVLFIGWATPLLSQGLRSLLGYETSQTQTGKVPG